MAHIEAIDTGTADKNNKTLTKDCREQAAKAEDIENAVHDLKAVNTHKKPVVDTRTPDELLDVIEPNGREIQEILAVLRK